MPGEVFLHLLDGDFLARLSVHGLNHRSICTVSQDLRKGVAIHFQGKIGGGECLSGTAWIPRQENLFFDTLKCNASKISTTPISPRSQLLGWTFVNLCHRPTSTGTVHCYSDGSFPRLCLSGGVVCWWNGSIPRACATVRKKWRTRDCNRRRSCI